MVHCRIHFNLFICYLKNKHIKTIAHILYYMSLSDRVNLLDRMDHFFNLRFKCQYKEVEEKYLRKKRENASSCCCESKADEPDEASAPETERGGEPTVEDDDILFLCEEVYREDFLKFFKLEHYDDTIVNDKTTELYKICSRNMLFALLIDDIKMHVNTLEDNECAFMNLFAYPFFYLTHECVKQLILNGVIEEGLCATIEEKVTKFFSK